jgi:MFS family permease
MMKSKQCKDLITASVIIWTFAVTISRSIRTPNDFSEAHWLLDYRFGFIKRGFIGSLYTVITDFLGLQKSPRLILFLSLITLCGMFAAMLFMLWNSHRRQQSKDLPVVLGVVFGSSPFVVMSAHLLGYFDAILYVLAMVSVGLVLRARGYASAIVSSVAILSHEAYLLIGMPLVCLASVVAISLGSARTSWRPYVVALLIPISVFLTISPLQRLTTNSEKLRTQLYLHLDSFDIVPTRSRDVATWQTVSLVRFFQSQKGAFFDRLLSPRIWASIGLPLLFILFIIYSSFRIRAYSLLSAALLCFIFAPLAMHAVAWDTARISTYLIGGAFIAYCVIEGARPTQGVGGSYLLIALPALFVNIVGSVPLMDGKSDRYSLFARMLLYVPSLAVVIAITVRSWEGKWIKHLSQGAMDRQGSAGDA